MKKKLEIIGLCLGWTAVLIQFVLILQNRQADIPETIIRFFSYFTILTNIMVAMFFTSRGLNFTTKPLNGFHNNETSTALTTFILIVGLVYQLVLRGLWEPQGMQRIVDELLHSIIPLYVLIYWFLFSEKGKTNTYKLGVWLLYPVLYLLFVFVRGSFSGYYPYPFLNISEIGIEKALLNSALILLLMLIIMAGLVAIKYRRADGKML